MDEVRASHIAATVLILSVVGYIAWQIRSNNDLLGQSEDTTNAGWPLLPIHPKANQEAIYNQKVKITNKYEDKQIPARNLDYYNPAQLYASTGPGDLAPMGNYATLHFNQEDGKVKA